MMEQDLPGEMYPENRAGDSSRDSIDQDSSAAGSADTSGLGFGAGVEGGKSASAPRRKRAPRRRKRSSSSTAKEAVTESKAGSDAESEASPARSRKKTTKAVKKTRRRSSRSPRGDSDGDSKAERPAEEGAATDEARDTGTSRTTKKRTRRRPTRKRAPATDESSTKRDADDAPKGADPSGGAPADSGASTDTGEDGDKKKRRRRGTRGGRRRKKASSSASEAVVVEAIPGEEDDLPERPARPAKKTRSRSRKKATRASGDSEATEESKPRAAKGRSRAASKKAEEIVPDQLILVNAIDREEKRVAVVESTRIVDFLMTVDSQKSLVNDIYRGRIVNMEPAIGAAFVDFGQGRNGFLHTSDVLSMYGEKGFELSNIWTTPIEEDEWEGSSVADDVDDDDDAAVESKDAGKDDAKAKSTKKRRTSSARRTRKREPISDLLSVGDPVVVQITKDAIGDKGPTLTTYVSMPGRYLVLMPSMARTGVSRKIPDDRERRRLKRILAGMDLPPNMGVIVRTAGVGKTKAELQRDLDYLMGLWGTFGKRLNSGRGPVPLYQESEVAIRTMRDLFSSQTEAVIVDDPIVHEQLVDFAHKLMPEQVDRIRLHDGDRPIFHHHGIEQDFEKILSRRVELPSGGSIVIDQTEALVAIDVNSGRTRTDGFDFENVALKTNLEAAPEIARQIRLRDLGGILVCDFIDMTRTSSMRTVERALRAAMVGDRARSKLGRISQFGLLEMTRQRLGPGMNKKVFQICPRCRGTARVRSVPSRAAAILRRLGSALTQKGFAAIEVRAHPEVVEFLDDELVDYLRALEHRFDREIRLTGIVDQPEDSVLRYLRSDGREVRPGGRRKR